MFSQSKFEMTFSLVLINVNMFLNNVFISSQSKVAFLANALINLVIFWS